MGALGGAGVAATTRGRAVVWSDGPSRSAADAALEESLRKRGVEPVRVESDLWAMAQVCGGGDGGGSNGGAGVLLVLCNPARLRGVAGVVLAMRKYAPRAVVYAFEPGAGNALRPVTDQDVVDWGAPGPVAPEPRPAPPRAGASGPALRLVDGGEPRPIGVSVPITEHTATAQDVLSAEELAMLLGREGRGHEGSTGNGTGDQR